jgi:hypothetical protein
MIPLRISILFRDAAYACGNAHNTFAVPSAQGRSGGFFPLYSSVLYTRCKPE